MGIITLQQFRDRLNFALGDKKQTSNEPLDRWINAGYQEAMGLVDMEEEKETAEAQSVAGQSAYGLPEDLYAIRTITFRNTDKSLSYESQHRLLFLDWTEFQQLDPDEDPGLPTHFTRRDRVLRLWPTPKNADETIIIQYIQDGCYLVAANDVTLLPQKYDNVVHLLGLKNAQMDLGLFEPASLSLQEAERYVNRIVSAEEERMGGPQEGINIASTREELIEPRKMRDLF